MRTSQIRVVLIFYSKAYAGCNIGYKTLFAERGKLPLKSTCPAGTSTCPATLFNKGCIGLCPKHYLLSGVSQGSAFQLAPLPFLCQIHLQLAIGQVVMLHADISHHRNKKNLETGIVTSFNQPSQIRFS